jgi:quercetin dioxygenase-like cupin family protein
MSQDTSSTRLNPSEEAISFGPVAVRILVAGSDSSDTLSQFEVLIDAGAGLPAPPHSNDTYEETIYGVDGTSTWTVDGTPFDVGPGQALCIRRGEVHRFANNTDQPARALVAITPAVLGAEYFRATAAELRAAAGGPPDRVKLLEIMRRNSMTPAIPPTES